MIGVDLLVISTLIIMIAVVVIMCHLCAGSIGAGQLAQLFQNLGNPLPYDRLVKIMSEYDTDKKGARQQSRPPLTPDSLVAGVYTARICPFASELVFAPNI